MALSDLQVFSEYAYSSMTEVLSQQVALFNAASRGTLVLSSAAHQGDFSDAAMWAKISGLVRRRNVYGSGSVTEKHLQHLLETSVKVAAGTPPIRIDPSFLRWIQRRKLGSMRIGGVPAATLTLVSSRCWRCFSVTEPEP